MRLPRRYRKNKGKYIPPQPTEALRKDRVDSFSLATPYDLLSIDMHSEVKGPNNVLENTDVSDKNI